MVNYLGPERRSKVLTRRFVLIVATLLALYVTAIFGLVQHNSSRDKSRDRADVSRDSARTYQRCVQNRQVTVVLNAGLQLSAPLRQLVRSTLPDLLDRSGQVPLPDCEKAYPSGARDSLRFPGEAPTLPAG